MAYLWASAFLTLLAFPLIGSGMAVGVLVSAQFLLLLRQIKKGQVTGVGAFIFMSFLFFGIRPLYILLESDYWLFNRLFLIRADLTSIGYAMWLASAGLWTFALAGEIFPRINSRWIFKRRAVNHLASGSGQSISTPGSVLLLLFQCGSLPVMLALAAAGRSLYGSGVGAYAYDLPVLLQAVHVFAVVVMMRNYVARRSGSSIAIFVVSSCLFLLFTWLMREVSMFRGFYLAGVMIAGIAVLQQLKGRVGYAWLILPIVVAQPFFAQLGEDRRLRNEELASVGISLDLKEEETLLGAYWQFYDAHGDMNIFDTFVAATKAQPAFYPYAWSWLYVPLHFIPRKMWSGKPERGVTQDVSFMRGAPYCPGIVGFFLLDGGIAWMLLSMFVLGYLLSWLDHFVMTMRSSALQSCLVGIVAINSMFLTRFFLWQFFSQMLYAILPCVLLAWLFRKNWSRPASRTAGAQGVLSSAQTRQRIAH
jgi:hypothetical protein